ATAKERETQTDPEVSVEESPTIDDQNEESNQEAAKEEESFLNPEVAESLPAKTPEPDSQVGSSDNVEVKTEAVDEPVKAEKPELAKEDTEDTTNSLPTTETEQVARRYNLRERVPRSMKEPDARSNRDYCALAEEYAGLAAER